MATKTTPKRLNSRFFIRTPTTPLSQEKSQNLLMSVVKSITKSITKPFFRQESVRNSLGTFSLSEDEEDEAIGVHSVPQELTREALIRAITHISPVPFSTWQEQLRVLQEVKDHIDSKEEEIKKPESLDSLIGFLDEILKNSVGVLGYKLTGIAQTFLNLKALKEVLTQIQNKEELSVKHQEKFEESIESDEEIKDCECAKCVLDQGYNDLSILEREQFETLHSVFSTMFSQKPPEEYEILVKVLTFITQKGTNFENVQYTFSKEEQELFRKALRILSEVEQDGFVQEFKKMVESVMKEHHLCLNKGDVERFESLQLQLDQRFQNIGIFYKLQKFVEVEFVNLFSNTVNNFIATHPNIELVKVHQMLLEFQRGAISKEKCLEVVAVLGKLDELNIAIESKEKERLSALKNEIEKQSKEEHIKLDLTRLELAIQDINHILKRNEGAWQTMQRDIKQFAEKTVHSVIEDVAHVFQQEFRGALKEAPQDLLDIQSVLKRCTDLTAPLSEKEQDLFTSVIRDLGQKRKDAPNGEKETYGNIADFLRANFKDGKMTVPTDRLSTLREHLEFVEKKIQEQSGLAVQFGQRMGQIFEATVKETAGDLTKVAPPGLLSIVRALEIVAYKEKFSDSDKLWIQLAKSEEKNIDSMQMDKDLKEELKQVYKFLNIGGIGNDQKAKVQKLLMKLKTEVLPQNQGVLTTAMQQISEQFARQFITSLEDTGLLSTLHNVQDISEKLNDMSKDIKDVTDDLKSVIDFIKTPLRVFMWSLIPLAFVTLIGGFWLTKIYIERKYPIRA